MKSHQLMIRFQLSTVGNSKVQTQWCPALTSGFQQHSSLPYERFLEREDPVEELRYFVELYNFIHLGSCDSLQFSLCLIYVIKIP